MKEKLIYKRPGTPGFGAHRDSAYNVVKTGVPVSEFVTIYIAIDQANGQNGAVEFYPDLRNVNLAAPPGEPRDVDERELLGKDSFRPDVKPGDLIIFDGVIPHRSAHNHSDYPRRTYMITYVPARYPKARKKYYLERRREQVHIGGRDDGLPDGV